MDELVKILHSLGFNFPYNEKDETAYHKDLDRVVNRSKTLSVQRDQKERELELLNKKQGSGKVTREYFDKYLVALSKFIGYHIKEEETTVSRFAAILNAFAIHCEQSKPKGNAKRPNR